MCLVFGPPKTARESFIVRVCELLSCQDLNRKKAHRYLNTREDVFSRPKDDRVDKHWKSLCWIVDFYLCIFDYSPAIFSLEASFVGFIIIQLLNVGLNLQAILDLLPE